jgi:hypothetical protein
MEDAMSTMSAFLANARPNMLRGRLLELIREEALKGCRPDVACEPVALEPCYRSLADQPAECGSSNDEIHAVPEAPAEESELVRLRLWISPEQQCSWNRCELFLKQLSAVSHRVAFEIVGNEQETMVQFLCHKDDVPVVRAVFLGQFEKCDILPSDHDPFQRVPPHCFPAAIFRDFYPKPPYSHLSTMPDELERSPYATVLQVLGEMPASALGVYQVAFAPLSPAHDWRQNIQTLFNVEYLTKTYGGLSSGQRYGQQIPSDDLRKTALAAGDKGHNDKPLFAASLRIGVLNGGDQEDAWLRSLAAMASLFLHGGHHLSHITEEVYPSEAIRDMFVQGMAYRPGFIINSRELASFVHVPPPPLIEEQGESLKVLETLPPDAQLSTGTPIGYSVYADKPLAVCIPRRIRHTHTHVVGGSDKGKTCLMARMALDDIRRGDGVAVLDPHGTLIQEILPRISEEDVERTIVINPGDPDWVPVWNPLHLGSEVDRGHVADEIIRAFKSFLSGWGHRLEHLLRQALFGILHLPGATLLDAFDILRKGSEESKQLRRLVRKATEGEVNRAFWIADYDRYSTSDLTPAYHKLSKLLTSGTLSLMLSQSQSAFTLREVMDTGKILLINLSETESDSRDVFGCFILSLLHLTALGRAGRPRSTHKAFHIYLDEAHRLFSDAIENLIAETRKFNVSLTAAHQYLAQFDSKKLGALSSVGSTIIFEVNSNDAAYLRRNLQDKVDVKDLTTLGCGDVIARIDKHVVRLRTFAPDAVETADRSVQIIEHSRSRYCKPVEEIRKQTRRRQERWQEPLSGFCGASPAASDASGLPPELSAESMGEEEFSYEEF